MLKNCRKLNLWLIITIVPMLLFVGCMGSHHSDEQPFTPLYTLEEISEGAFRGGSLIRSSKAEINQLVEGMEIPFRISSIPQEARRARMDYEQDITYGYMKIKSILSEQSENGCGILFDYVLFNDDGSVHQVEKDVQLTADAESDQVDLNNDGISDLFYDAFGQMRGELTQRSSFKEAEFLRFSDPRDNGNGSSFRLLPDQYAEEEIPSGILTVNPNGALVTTSQFYDLYENVTPTATVVAFASEALPEIKAGDFILDVKTERFRKVTKVLETNEAFTIYESTDTTIDEAFITFDLEYTKPFTLNIQQDPSSSQERLNWEYDFDKVIWEKQKVTEHGTFTQTLEATGNVSVDVELHVSFHAGIKWHWWPPHPSIELSCDAGLSFNFDHHFFIDYKAVEVYERKWTRQLFDEIETIMVDVVPVNLEAKGTVGLDLDANVEADVWTGYRLNGGLNAGVGFSLGHGFHHNFDHSLNFSRYGPEMKVKGKMTAKPYFDLKLALGIAYVAWVESDTIPYGLGVLDGNAGVYLDEDYKIQPEDMWIDFNLYGGLEQDITLRLGYKWFSIHKTFELYNGKWPIWDIEFKWPRNPEDFQVSGLDYRKTTFDWIDRSKVETGYRLFHKPYGSEDFTMLVTLPANTQNYVFNGNEDSLVSLKAYYHVKHLDFDIYQILSPETVQIIACPEMFTGTPINGNPLLTWHDVSQMNTETDIYIKKENDPDYTKVATVTGDLSEVHYTMPENIDSQFKARALYKPNGSDEIFSAYSNVYQWLAIPTGMTGFPYKDGEILLKWQNNSHKSQGYDLWIEEYLKEPKIEVITDPSTKSFVVTKVDGVSWDTKDARFKIRNYIYDTTLATNTYSGWSNIFQWLAVPTDFAIERVYDNNILTWKDHSQCETGYEIWKQVDENHAFKTGVCGENQEKYLDKPQEQYKNEEFAYKIRAYKSGSNESGYSDWSPFIIYNFRAPDSLRIVHDEPSGKDFLMWDNHSTFQTGIRLLRRPKGNGFFETYKDIAGTNLEGYELNESEKGYEYILQGFYREEYIEQYTADTNMVVYE